MTAVTLSTTKADVMAAKKELQDRIPTKYLNLAQASKFVQRVERLAFTLLIFGPSFVALPLIFKAPIAAVAVSATVGLAACVISYGLIKYCDKVLKEARVAACNTFLEGREKPTKSSRERYKNVVSAYAAARRDQKLQAA